MSASVLTNVYEEEQRISRLITRVGGFVSATVPWGTWRLKTTVTGKSAHGIPHTQLNRPSRHWAAWWRLTIAMAAAATAVLTGVPGMTLLSEVLTSTATMKRLPTGSTFWKQNRGVSTVSCRLCCALTDWNTPRSSCRTQIRSLWWCCCQAPISSFPGILGLSCRSLKTWGGWTDGPWPGGDQTHNTH